MASSPVASFEHVWHRLMSALGISHPRQLRANRVLIRQIDRNMGRK